MIRLTLYSVFLFILQISILRSQSLPDWVEEMPQDSKYYWARESVGIRGLSEEEYKEKANIRALSTISMQIRTTVSGQARSSFSEVTADEGSSFKDEFIEESSTSTIADIQGAERVVSTLTQQPIGFSGDLINLSTQKTWRNLLKQPKTSMRGLLSGRQMTLLVNYSILFLRTRPLSKLQGFLHYSMGKI